MRTRKKATYWALQHMKEAASLRKLGNQYRYDPMTHRHYLAPSPELWLNPQAHTIHLDTRQIGIYIDRTRHPDKSCRYVAARLTEKITRTHDTHLRILLDILTNPTRTPTRRNLPIEVHVILPIIAVKP